MSSPRETVQRLLSLLVGAYKSADSSSDSGAYVDNIELSRHLSDRLRKAARSCNDTVPRGLDEFLETVGELEADGRRLDDGQLLGLTDWASSLRDASLRENVRQTTKDEDRMLLNAAE